MTQLPLIMLLLVQIQVSWFKHSVVLNGLRYGTARLFISFVSRRSTSMSGVRLPRIAMKQWLPVFLTNGPG